MYAVAGGMDFEREKNACELGSGFVWQSHYPGYRILEIRRLEYISEVLLKTSYPLL